MTTAFTRRRFLAASAKVSLAAAAFQARVLNAQPSSRRAHVRLPGEPDPHALAARAVDAARSAGAAYADVRLTDTRDEMYYNGSAPMTGQKRGIGVRVLVDGVWGFQSSAVWTVDEAAKLARAAVAQAKATAPAASRRVELGPPPPTVTGEWVMPVKVDPFTVPIGEKVDFTNYVLEHAGNFTIDASATYVVVWLRRQSKTFASSDGSAWTQTTFLSQGDLGVGYRDNFVQRLGPGSVQYEGWTPAGRGWEMFAEAPLSEEFPRLFDEAEQARHVVPVEPDRGDAVFSAHAMAALLDNTLGAATELDRAMGYEANASGTSYLNEPLDMAGALVIGRPAITITGNRSLAGGAATVKWDDDSVVPQDFTLVDRGRLVDFQTTREQVAWMAPYYKKASRPLLSHGCAGAESALTVTMQCMPNLQLMPGVGDTSFEDLVAGTKKGIAVLSMYVDMDQQQLTGLGYARVRKIVNGKLGPYLNGAGVQFRAPEMWKNLTALGGAKSARWFGVKHEKGQPIQQTAASIGAVPARIENVDLIDVNRRA
jgi:TldD protein